MKIFWYSNAVFFVWCLRFGAFENPHSDLLGQRNETPNGMSVNSQSLSLCTNSIEFFCMSPAWMQTHFAPHKHNSCGLWTRRKDKMILNEHAVFPSFKSLNASSSPVFSYLRLLIRAWCATNTQHLKFCFESRYERQWQIFFVSIACSMCT